MFNLAISFISAKYNITRLSVVESLFLIVSIPIGYIEMEDGGWTGGDITSDMVNELHKKIWDVPQALKEA